MGHRAVGQRQGAAFIHGKQHTCGVAGQRFQDEGSRRRPWNPPTKQKAQEAGPGWRAVLWSQQRQRRTTSRSRRHRGTTVRCKSPRDQATRSPSRAAVPVIQDAAVHWEHVQASALFKSYKAWIDQAGNTGCNGLKVVDNVRTFGRVLRALGLRAMPVRRGKAGCKSNHYINMRIVE